MDFVEIIKSLMDFILHVDEHLFVMIQEYGLWVYILLFIVIFVETGLVVMPFLPGDSLLFAAGAFCAGVVNDAGVTAKLSLPIIIVSLIIAAVIGDTVNYSVGKNLGLKILNWKIKGYQLVKKEYIDQTQTFMQNMGLEPLLLQDLYPSYEHLRHL